MSNWPQNTVKSLICNFVSAKGLTANEDQTHFNASSLRKFGLRYNQAFLNTADVNEALPDEDELLGKIYERELSSNENKFILDGNFASGKISLSEFQNQLNLIQTIRHLLRQWSIFSDQTRPVRTCSYNKFHDQSFG